MLRWPRPHAAAMALLALLALPARAALFEDDEARKAVLEVRQRVQQLEQINAKQAADAAKTQAQLIEQVQVLQRSVLDLNAQLETLRSEIAKLRGTDEQLTRDLAEVQRRQKDITQGVDDRIRKLEPLKVSVDGREFVADPEEKRLFDDALAVLRNGDYDKAAASFGAFLRRYPGSGYVDSARFWLGNALYGKREYKEAIASFRAVASNAPDHPRAPEALLALANCQIESKDPKGARATIGELIKAYPKSEAAQAGRERLAALK
ncbi:MAG TPA: tol-pal system protein YbgF [Burkholderiaceae bacterium]|nr:tol-pal system protein YbgF [Burkholderiaceae bacterium]